MWVVVRNITNGTVKLVDFTSIKRLPRIGETLKLAGEKEAIVKNIMTSEEPIKSKNGDRVTHFVVTIAS